ncbi:MAG: hypothetical protein ACJ8AO_00940 [Gemmatimonadaceae bacterium]
MGSSPRRLSIVATLALLVLAACTDASAPVAPAAPAPAAAVSVSGDDFAAPTDLTTPAEYIASGRVLQRAEPLREAVWTWAYVTPTKEVTLHLSEAGLKVTIPVGAVPQAMYVWVVAYPGSDVLYEFGPHGTQFEQRLSIQQDLRVTTAYRNPLLANELFGGYAPAGREDVGADGTVQLAETFDVDLTPDNNRKPRWAKFYTTHFSGYVLASGRTTTR